MAKSGAQKQDLPEILASLCINSCHSADAAPVCKKTLHEAELEQVFPAKVEELPREFEAEHAEPRVAHEMPVDSPKEEKASTMQTSHASRFIDFGNFISFDYPPHPEEEDAKRLTEDVLQMLMSRFVSTKEPDSGQMTSIQWAKVTQSLE